MHHLSIAVIASNCTPREASVDPRSLPRCMPGEPVELVPQPHPDADELTLQVVTEDGLAIGQLTSERSDWIQRVMSKRRVRAVYQQAAAYGAVIRVAFDGEQPTVPATQQ